MTPLADLLQRFRRGWTAGLPLTPCGSGSLPENTVNARSALARWCGQYGLQTVNDAGAGDLCWLQGLRFGTEYRAFDLVPRHPDVLPLDISTEAMPSCDLIVCRWVLNHLDPERVDSALSLFRQSGGYLAATQFDGGRRCLGHLDLRPALGPYLDAVPDAGVDGCTLALWRLCAD
jgi:hypothetical protein